MKPSLYLLIPALFLVSCDQVMANAPVSTNFISITVVLLAVFLLLKKSTRPFGLVIIVGIIFFVSYVLIVVDSPFPVSGFVLAAWGGMGLIGLFLGYSVNRVGAGFLLGFLLGPIGWIIVFLLPRKTSINSNPLQTPTMDAYKTWLAKKDDINKLAERTKTAQERLSSQTQTPKERPPRDLASDAYKIWLGKKYEVTRNELFDQFECDEKLFESLDDALKYADELEAQERQRLEAQIEKEKAADLPSPSSKQIKADLPSPSSKQIKADLQKKNIKVHKGSWKDGALINKITDQDGKEHFVESHTELLEYYNKVMNK